MLSTATTNAAAETDKSSYAALMAQIRDMAIQAKAKVLSVCPLGMTPPKPSTGTLVYTGVGVAGVATSPTGVVALADLGSSDGSRVLISSRVLIYTQGLSEKPISVPIPGAFLGGSLKVSNDGRFVAWAAGIDRGPTIYDIARARVQELPQTPNPCALQWIGDDLLVRNCPDEEVLFRKGEIEFAPVQTTLDAREAPHSLSLSRHATSDQLGESFVRGATVYPTMTAAEAAGAIVVSPIGHEAQPLRVGQELFVLGLLTAGVETPKDRMEADLRAGRASVGLIRMSDGRAIDFHDPVCSPRAMAASPSGTTFAILQGRTLLQFIDARTLTVIGSYSLDGPRDQPPEEIEFASDDTLLVMTRTEVRRHIVPTVPH
jgi:hypothetical protein